MSDETNKILIDNLAEKVALLSKRLSDVEEEIWGFPKGKGEGLLQKVRDSNRKWAIVGFVVCSLGGFTAWTGKVIFEKYAVDAIFNSPSQKWYREQQRPKIKRIKIVVPRETNG